MRGYSNTGSRDQKSNSKFARCRARTDESDPSRNLERAADSLYSPKYPVPPS